MQVGQKVVILTGLCVAGEVVKAGAPAAPSWRPGQEDGMVLCDLITVPEPRQELRGIYVFQNQNDAEYARSRDPTVVVAYETLMQS